MQNDQQITRSAKQNTPTRFIYFLLGSTVGAAVALLLAPKSGYDLRGDIADVTRKGIDRTCDTATQLGARAGEYYEPARDLAPIVENLRRSLEVLVPPAPKPINQTYGDEEMFIG